MQFLVTSKLCTDFYLNVFDCKKAGVLHEQIGMYMNLYMNFNAVVKLHN